MKDTIKTIFEYSRPGVRCVTMPGAPEGKPVPENLRRKDGLKLPEVSESTLMRHYTVLKNHTFGVDSGFYPLGSCTMKYNPKVNEKIASMEAFTDIHPLSGEEDAQGFLEVLFSLQSELCKITGMDAFCVSPCAGSHGEWTGLNLIRAYHQARGDSARKIALIPDSAHGTNPANAAIAGFTVVNLPSKDGTVDLEVLAKNLTPETAVLMMTNPNTLGLFEKDILKIADMCHKAGALLYYDGANLNAVMGVCRPADMGFDAMHVNLHKTFSTPHGGGGPGSGPVGCKAFLKEYLPAPVIQEDNGRYFAAQPAESIGRVSSFYGNALVALRAYAYILSLGAEGLAEASARAVVNANYFKKKIGGLFGADAEPCMHEFVVSLEKLKEETGASALDFAKALLDRGMHPPTIYFPLIVHEALMIEPTETESRESLDQAAQVFKEIVEAAKADPGSVKSAPVTTPVSRPDETAAARNPRLKFEW
jgi:glycine dehydrogenase subunit 2